MKRVLVRRHLRMGLPVRQHWSVRYARGKYVFDTVGGRKASVDAGSLEKADASVVRALIGLAQPSDREGLGRVVLEEKVIGSPTRGPPFVISSLKLSKYSL